MGTSTSRTASDTTFDVIVIGAGLVGLATAMALLDERPALRVGVLEGGPAAGTPRGGPTPGVVPGGRGALLEFAASPHPPYRQSGTPAEASPDSELPRLADLADRGRANGLAV